MRKTCLISKSTAAAATEQGEGAGGAGAGAGEGAGIKQTRTSQIEIDTKHCVTSRRGVRGRGSGIRGKELRGEAGDEGTSFAPTLGLGNWDRIGSRQRFWGKRSSRRRIKLSNSTNNWICYIRCQSTGREGGKGGEI